MEVDYSKTVNLPKTNFSMKANLVQKEPQIIKFWQQKDIYNKILEKNRGKKNFILHDGPPYANGHIHIGHALNKILKDIVVKYKSLCGEYSPYIPGWDCHGLPIEYQLFKELKISKDQISQIDFRKKAKEYAEKFVEIQKDEFIRLGVFGDWANPYLTMTPEYEKNIISTLTTLVKKGYIVRRKKPVYWCINCETSLAEAEVEYEEKISDSIYVKFPVIQLAKNFGFRVDHSLQTLSLEKLYILIWTTTPWTLPANVALAIKPDAKYVIAQYKDEYYVLMETRLQHLQSLLNTKLTVVKEFYGCEIAHEEKEFTTICSHPFIDKVSYCVPYENVSTQEGTGIIHIAPGHGEEDYLLGLKYNLPIYSPVDNLGRFNDVELKKIDVPIYGVQVTKSNDIIIQHLKTKNFLLHYDKIQHSYPHCWRCKKPVIFRATEQWFLLIDHQGLRTKILENIKKVNWVPQYGENRISSMVQLRPDWCLSRQRYWGVPIPAVYCSECGKVYLEEKILKKVEEIFAKEGSDSWFVRNIEDFLPPDFQCSQCGNKKFNKETDILDVWYDSAVSYKTLSSLDTENYPVMYLEGSDQHRGWFQVALIISTAVDGKPPYNIVLTHGFVVDGEGRKMSKSLGNVISPQEIIQHHGAEILRLWAASANYSEDIRISKEILDRLIETYRKIRNTIRYILGNLYDFSLQEKEFVFDPLDKYILSRMSFVVSEVIQAYQEYKFYKVVTTINNFFIKELSNFYFDILKDKLYTYKRTSIERVSSQRVLYQLLTTLLPLLAPVLSFTAEEAWQEAKSMNLVKEDSVFLTSLENYKNFFEYRDIQLEHEFEIITDVRDAVNTELEKLRRDKIIGSSLEAEVELTVYDKEYIEIVQKYKNMLKTIFIVSCVRLNIEQPSTTVEKKYEVVARKYNGIKCPRCWIYYESLQPSGVCSKCEIALNE